MCKTTKMIEEELRDIHCRLQKVEEFIRLQNVADSVLLPKVLSPDTEADFYNSFSQECPGFISRLRLLIPAITPSEERLCMLIKLNMTIREVSRILNIDVKSVHTSRARLKRKVMTLTNEVVMDEWIRSI